MTTAETRNLLLLRTRESRPPPVEDAPWLVLGGAPPSIPGIDFDARIGEACAGIILLGRIEPAALAAVLDEVPDPGVPIADFGDNGGLRRDFVGNRLDAETMADLEHCFAPIWHRLAAFPFRTVKEDRAELAMLRTAYARDKSMQASFAPVSTLLVDYPLFPSMAALRHRLEGLANLDLLRRRHFTRTHACRKCASSRLHVYEACPACGSGELTEQKLVHHYRCGWQEPESKFVAGHDLICPKCRRELRHFGVDYGKPGDVSVCRACSAANAEPDVHFVCLDCAAVTPAIDAPATDWYHYDVTEEALRALNEGRLPRFEVGPLLEARTRAFSPREFRLLTTEGVRIASRYDRPFAVARLSLANVDALRHECGAVQMHLAFRVAVDTIVESLRDSDFVAADGSYSVLIGFPETPPEIAAQIVQRVRTTIGNSIAKPIVLTADIAGDKEVVDLLSEDQ